MYSNGTTTELLSVSSGYYQIEPDTCQDLDPLDQPLILGFPQNLFGQYPYKLYLGQQVCLNGTESCDVYETFFPSKTGESSAIVGFVSNVQTQQPTTQIGSLLLDYSKDQRSPFLFVIYEYQNTVDESVFKVPSACQ